MASVRFDTLCFVVGVNAAGMKWCLLEPGQLCVVKEVCFVLLQKYLRSQLEEIEEPELRVLASSVPAGGGRGA